MAWTTPLFAKFSTSPFAYGSLKFEWHMLLFVCEEGGGGMMEK